MNQSYTQAINNTIQEAKEVKTLQDGWTVLKQGKYVTLSSQKYKDHAAPLLKIEGTVSTTVQSVQKYFYENLAAIAKVREQSCDGLENLEVLDQDTSVSVFKLKSFQNFPAKEALNIRHRQIISPNEVLIVTSHLEEHPKLPKQQGVDRIHTILNAQFFTQVDAKNTNILFFFLNDTKVALPAPFLEKMIESFVDHYDKDIENILSN